MNENSFIQYMPAHDCLLANETAPVVGSYPDLPSWEEGDSIGDIGHWARLATIYIVGASWAKVFENIWLKS